MISTWLKIQDRSLSRLRPSIHAWTWLSCLAKTSNLVFCVVSEAYPHYRNNRVTVANLDMLPLKLPSEVGSRVRSEGPRPVQVDWENGSKARTQEGGVGQELVSFGWTDHNNKMRNTWEGSTLDQRHDHASWRRERKEKWISRDKKNCIIYSMDKVCISIKESQRSSKQKLSMPWPGESCLPVPLPPLPLCGGRSCLT